MFLFLDSLLCGDLFVALRRLIIAVQTRAFVSTQSREGKRGQSGSGGTHYTNSAPMQANITHVTGRDRVERAKPAPDVVLHALQAVRAEASAAIMVGDSDADVLAARAAGVPAWAVLGGVGEEKTLRDAGADLILANGVGELPDHLMR